MKISEIKKTEEDIYEVSLKPNWFEKIFTIKEKIIRIQESMYQFSPESKI